MVEGWLQQEIHANQGSNWRNQGLESFLVKLRDARGTAWFQGSRHVQGDRRLDERWGEAFYKKV